MCLSHIVDSGVLSQRVNKSIYFLQVSTAQVKNSINNIVIDLVCDFLHKVFATIPALPAASR